MAARALTQCEQCGQTDDHPKIHIGPRTTHHDCLSATDKEMVIASSDTAAGIIDVCEKGTRGADLLAHIEKIHSPDNTVSLTESDTKAGA